MTRDQLVLLAMWAISIGAVFLLIPVMKRRKAVLAYLACQAETWLRGMIHAKYHLLAWPAREFPKATDLGFTTEYFFYPLMCAFYVIYEPKRSIWVRFIYLSACISILVLYKLLLMKYTHIFRYVHYAWYWSWLNLFIEFLLANIYCRWFYKDRSQLQSLRRNFL